MSTLSLIKQAARNNRGELHKDLIGAVALFAVLVAGLYVPALF